ncbi:MAG: creatininase family protein [Anaerolineales bacterium]
MVSIYRYTDLRPNELTHRLEQYPVAIAPWGALEWHGPHLPFGLDGLVAEAFGEHLAEKTGAILLPTTYLPITALPHAQSIPFRTDVVRGSWEDLLLGLGSAGFKLVCLISGHYAQGHEIVLSEVAEQVTRDQGPLVLAGTPLALLGDPALLDHAGLWETSQLLASRPDLVDLKALPPETELSAKDVAVLGPDPRSATAAKGREILGKALEAWSDWIERLLSEDDPQPLYDLYSERRSSYQGYVDQYYDGSWEKALESWWAERSG